MDVATLDHLGTWGLTELVFHHYTVDSWYGFFAKSVRVLLFYLIRYCLWVCSQNREVLPVAWAVTKPSFQYIRVHRREVSAWPPVYSCFTLLDFQCRNKIHQECWDLMIVLRSIHLFVYCRGASDCYQTWSFKHGWLVCSQNFQMFCR